MDTLETVEPTVVGLFEQLLTRSNKEIKGDRALTLIEDASLTYEREIQDMEMTYKKLGRKRDNMLDLSPTNADSLILGKEFDSKGFVNGDISIGVDQRNLQVKLEIAYARFHKLFGRKFNSTVVFTDKIS